MKDSFTDFTVATEPQMKEQAAGEESEVTPVGAEQEAEEGVEPAEGAADTTVEGLDETAVTSEQTTGAGAPGGGEELGSEEVNDDPPAQGGGLYIRTLLLTGLA